MLVNSGIGGVEIHDRDPIRVPKPLASPDLPKLGLSHESSDLIRTGRLSWDVRLRNDGIGPSRFINRSEQLDGVAKDLVLQLQATEVLCGRRMTEQKRVQMQARGFSKTQAANLDVTLDGGLEVNLMLGTGSRNATLDDGRNQSAGGRSPCVELTFLLGVAWRISRCWSAIAF